MSTIEGRRNKERLDYHALHHGHAKTLKGFDFENEMTPRTTKFTKRAQDEDVGDTAKQINCEIDSDEEIELERVETINYEGGDDECECVEEEDEELVELKRELQEMKDQKKMLLEKKKQQLKSKIEAERKEIKALERESKLKSEKPISKVKQGEPQKTVKLQDLRANDSISKKVESKISKILDFRNRNDSETETSEMDNTDSSSSSTARSSKSSRLRLHKHKTSRSRINRKKSGIFDHPSDEVIKKQAWPQSKLQFEYAGSKIEFEDLEFNLFVAGEMEIISSSSISEVEKNGRMNLLKRIAYYTEVYEWCGIKKFYTHVIRQIENGIKTWADDFTQVEIPLLI